MTDCYIIGCGPNGERGYPDVPWDAQKVLVNAAIRLVKPHSWSNFIWMVSDNTVVDTDYFKDYYQLYKDRLHGSGQVAERVEVANEFQENPWMEMPSYWERGKTPDVKPMEGGIFRGGGTVAGCALHRCYWMGMRPVLCGIDLGGQGNSQEPFVNYEVGYWDSYRDILDYFIPRYLPGTISLTDTTLNVRTPKDYNQKELP